MKKVLVIDKCSECHLCGYDMEVDVWGCSVEKVILDDVETIPSWCPLQTIPEQKVISNEIN